MIHTTVTKKTQNKVKLKIKKKNKKQQFLFLFYPQKIDSIEFLLN